MANVPVIMGMGKGLVVTSTVSVSKQPFVLVTVTVNWPGSRVVSLVSVLPSFQRTFVKNGLTEIVVLSPSQKSRSPLMFAFGTIFWVTVVASTPVHPLALVTVTKYCPGSTTWMIWVVSPVELRSS